MGEKTVTFDFKVYPSLTMEVINGNLTKFQTYLSIFDGEDKKPFLYAYTSWLPEVDL
jgi:hypothetical protein